MTGPDGRRTSESEIGRALARRGPLAGTVLLGEYRSRIELALVAAGRRPCHARRLVPEVVLIALDLATHPSFGGVDDPWEVVRQAVEVVAARRRCGGLPIDLRLPAAPDHARSMHLVDVDNLVGGPSRAVEWFTTALAEFRFVADVGAEDQFFLAADASAWCRTAFSVKGVSYFPGFGADGADRVLLSVADPDQVAERFDRLVIGSGDHCFAPLAEAVQERGVDVTVVAREGELATDLGKVTTDLRLLDALPMAA